jgi:predicted transcriptional regulator YdeE
MQIARNIILAIIITVSVMLQVCNGEQKDSNQPAPKAQKSPSMNFDIKERDAFTVMGTQTRITSADMKNPDTYTKIWDALEQYRTHLRPLSIEQRSFGVTFATDKKDIFDYLAGVSVHSDAKSPDPNLITRNIPAAKYAVFKTTSEDMSKTYQYIYSEWLPASRYKLDTKVPCFEQYAPREWMNRPVYIYIPIVTK